MKKLSFILFSVILLCAGCRKDKLVVTETRYLSEDPEILINTSVTGVVIDEDKNPLENVAIKLGQHQATTDDNGFFYLKDILANQNGASVQAEKSGYFPTSQLVFPELNSVEFVKIKLIKSNETGLVNATTGGTIDIGHGATVEFPSNSFELNGSAYSGSVSVHATFIDPLADDLFERMPGSLLGVDVDGRIMGMETFGMIGVELYTNSGEKVELADDKKATLTFPLPDEIVAEAPSEIKLWHFDEVQGYWMEEGTATLNGTEYIAEVSHFSFWNCDDPFPTIILEGRVVNGTGNGVANAKIQLKRMAPTNNTGYAITSDDGRFSGKVPSNEVLEMEVYDPCGSLVSTETVGPFTGNTDLSDIVLSTPVEASLSGQIVDCNDAAVDYGYLMVKTQQDEVLGYLTTDANGQFSGSLSFCMEEDFKVEAVDLTNSLKSETQTVPFESVVDLGVLQACDEIVPTFRIIVEGEEFILGNANASIYVDTSMGSPMDFTSLNAEDQSGFISLGIDGAEEGTFEVQWISGQLVIGSNRSFSEPRIDVTFTRYDDAGPDAFIIGTFEGVVYDNLIQGDVNVEGSFNAKRL